MHLNSFHSISFLLVSSSSIESIPSLQSPPFFFSIILHFLHVRFLCPSTPPLSMPPVILIRVESPSCCRHFDKAGAPLSDYGRGLFYFANSSINLLSVFSAPSLNIGASPLPNNGIYEIPILILYVQKGYSLNFLPIPDLININFYMPRKKLMLHQQVLEPLSIGALEVRDASYTFSYYVNEIPRGRV